MATGFRSNQAEPLTHVNTHSPRYVSVAEYMDTVNTVNIVHTIADISFSCKIGRSEDSSRWEYIFFPP